MALNCPVYPGIAPNRSGTISARTTCHVWCTGTLNTQGVGAKFEHLKIVFYSYKYTEDVEAINISKAVATKG